MKMSQFLIDLNDAIALISAARKECYSAANPFGWDKTYNAGQYLERQVRTYFAPEKVATA